MERDHHRTASNQPKPSGDQRWKASIVTEGRVLNMDDVGIDFLDGSL
jgi:hypothetical protein